MEIEKTSIDKALLSAIKEAHARAEESTVDARGHMDRAINNRIMCASLVEKAKQMHRQDISGYLADVMTGQQIKAYLSLNDAARKRPALHDKRQLLLCGILETADKPEQEEPRNVTPPSVISTASSFIGRFNRIVDKRPVEEWQQSEREQVKDVLKPLYELYNTL